nr:IS5 family transposase [Actinopolyspora halophila]
MDDLSRRLVPDELWDIAAPLLPEHGVRHQGGGRRRASDRSVFTAIVFVLTSGCSWRQLPPSFGVSVPTAHRRFQEWTQAGVWRRLHRAVLDELGSAGDLDWERAIVDGASVRAKKRGTATGPNPVDRGKSGSKLHILTEAGGLPLAVAVSGANTHDMNALKPLVHAIPAVRSRRGPRRRRPAKLHADKGYDYEHLRTWLRDRNIVPRIARVGVESHARLGRYRWRVERTFAWLFTYRRLAVRWERTASNLAGMLTLAAAITCYKHLAK